MNRLATIAVLILLLAGLVGAALITRYRYYDVQGIPLYRIDGWTGMREQWVCQERVVESSKRQMEETGTGNELYRRVTVSGWDANQ